MNRDNKEYEYQQFVEDATGSKGESRKWRIVSYPFGRYLVKLKLGRANEFLEIVEISLNKDLLSEEQKIALKGYHDVGSYYTEE
ncbi:hypothetical protein Dform_00275 [Dehalogenimonas formicexedens]|uniref:Uncharacterized protein n=1 Tax=Dehalogenimonas formicexedens TaxID=1839801 RepID=A0A1P8F5B2_9CHLR|nr:hypothetical protein [Dehalogenimonas formicexedens]APV43635.1 hypothetical protein Dform_00275 [Dehalogenimonas formicexedens]